MSARVLQVVLSLDPGGTERLVLELALRLDPEIPTTVCCLDEAGAWAGALETRGIEVHALNRRPGFKPALGRAIAELARRHSVTVIHAHHYSPFVYSCIARLIQPGLQVVFTEHGRLSDARPSAKRRVANQMLSRIPRRVFAVSDDLRHHLAGEGFNPRAVEVIYNGIDIGPLPDAAARECVRRALGADEDTLVIGTIARLDPVKDIGTLIRAAAQIAAACPVVVAIVGDGPERRNLEHLAADLHIASSVRFIGHRDDARRWLAGCDIYVNSSISEGVSLTILEAMAAGLPIVATSVGGTPEVVDASCGRLVPARDPAALSQVVLDLACQSPEARRDIGRAARLRAQARFTVDRMVKQYRDVYYEVA